MIKKIASKEFTFDSAHFLPRYNGPCKRLHGHTYRLIVSVIEISHLKRDMVIDFAKLKKIVKKEILDRYDHRCLNDLPEYKYCRRPTAENMVEEIWRRLRKLLPGLYEIKLWETPTSFITYRGI